MSADVVRELKAEAKRKNCSVSEVVREAWQIAYLQIHRSRPPQDE
jgi:hypothetical protein